MRWKLTIIVLAGLSALAFGLGTRQKPQRPVLHELIAPVAQTLNGN